MCDYEYKYGEREGESCPHDKYGKVKWEGKIYCIFHASMEAEDKRAKDFWEAFDKLISDFKREKAKEWDFEGFIFPDTEDKFREYEFPEKVNIIFRCAQFMENADFSRAQFKGEANFRDATFESKAYFTGAIFKNKTEFSQVVFKEEVDYNNTLFSGSCRFFASKFLKRAFFEKTEFKGIADFWRARFSNRAEFANVKFKDEAIFRGVGFEGTGNFLRAEFYNETKFDWARFSQMAYFFESTYYNKADFAYTSFMGTVDFSRSKIKGNLRFRSSNFLSQVDFQGADVGELNFAGATFKISPYLGDLGAALENVFIKNLKSDVVIEFTRGYNNSKTFKLHIIKGEMRGVFSVRAPLEGITLKGTTFRATVNIAPKVFGEKPLFSAYEVNFLGDVSIDDIYLVEMVKCNIGGDFRIAESDLSQAWFRRVDLSLIDFTNVSWTKILRRRSSLILLPFRFIGAIFKTFGNWLSRVRILYRETDGLYNEIIMGDMKTLKKIYIAPNLKEKDKDRNRRLEEMYRAVASAYEGRRRYGQAGHFKAGEFEVRRSHTNLLERIVLAFYRCISFYGEEPLKPLAILLLIIFVPAIAYFFTGVPESVLEKGAQSFRYFHYQLCSEDLKFSLQPVADFLKSLSLSFQACLPVKTTLVESLCGWLSFLPALQRGLFAIFTAFLLFALRRKARR